MVPRGRCGLPRAGEIRRPPRDDAALLEAVAEGNQEAMAAVYERYSKIVYCIALRVLREPSLAEDVMQERERIHAPGIYD